MTIKQLYSNFTQGLKWNALFYVFRKSLSIALVFLLFLKLPMQDFSLWANIHSAIFLLLLWLDFGFRKSIPRYSPEFAKNKACMKKFVRYIVLFQIMVLIATIPFFLLIATYVTKTLGLANKMSLFYLGCAVFVSEGIISVFRLVYHSYFWQKKFNLQMSGILLIKTVICICFLFILNTPIFLLQSLFVVEIIAGIIAILISAIRLKNLYKDKDYPGNQQIDFKKTIKRFIAHSSIMWLNNNLKSLTERNFLMLFFTYSLGPYAANLFKLANDSALLFYRTIKKTIGTTDTSLLAHIETLKKKQPLLPDAFVRLVKKITSLCIPLAGVLLIVCSLFYQTFPNTFVFTMFLCITIFYLIESILSPYERILEVKQRYWLLAQAYVPYIVLFCAAAGSKLIPYCGLFHAVLIIHAVRVLSFLIMAFLVKNYYHLSFPFRKVFFAFFCTIFGL